MRCVGFLIRRGIEEALTVARELATYVATQGLTAALAMEGNLASRSEHITIVSEAQMAAAADLLVVLGGDGTLLHGAQLVTDRAVPILGVNMGRLGFLTVFTIEEALPALQRALSGELAIEERMRLEVRHRTASGETIVRHALNDAVVAQTASRLIELSASLNGERLATYRADGLIVSTATGSTAYTLAAGGPILEPQVDAVVLTPLCPHTLSNRPLVVPGSSRIGIGVHVPGTLAALSLDGRRGSALSYGDEIEIVRAAQSARLYRPSQRSYLEILRTKLGWGTNR